MKKKQGIDISLGTIGGDTEMQNRLKELIAAGFGIKDEQMSVRDHRRSDYHRTGYVFKVLHIDRPFLPCGKYLGGIAAMEQAIDFFIQGVAIGEQKVTKQWQRAAGEASNAEPNVPAEMRGLTMPQRAAIEAARDYIRNVDSMLDEVIADQSTGNVMRLAVRTIGQRASEATKIIDSTFFGR